MDGRQSMLQLMNEGTRTMQMPNLQAPQQDLQMSIDPMTPANRESVNYIGMSGGQMQAPTYRDFGGYLPTPSPTPSSFGQQMRKRTRFEEEMEPPSTSMFRQTGLSIFSRQGEIVADVAQAIEGALQAQSRTDHQLEKIEKSLSAILERIEQLELISAPKETPVVKEKRKEQNTVVIGAVHAAARALLGVAEIRNSEGTIVIELPHPLQDGEPERMDAGGNRIWNPSWLDAQPLKNDYNLRFINALTATVIANAKAPDSAHPIPEKDCTVDVVGHYARQAFRSLSEKYKKNNITKHKEAGEKKNDQSRYSGRVKGKYTRRAAVGVIQAFEEKHGITGIAKLVKKEYMSSECDKPRGGDETDKEEWKEHVKHYLHPSQKALMVVRKTWRGHKLSRIFYALDQISFDPKTPGVKAAKVVHVRVHGLPKHAKKGQLPNKILAPKYIINPIWLDEQENKLALVDGNDPMPDWWNSLDILDSELHRDDVAALNSWVAEEIDAGAEADNKAE